MARDQRGKANPNSKARKTSKKKNEDGLTYREAKFVEFYEGPGTGALAARKAGYPGPPDNHKNVGLKIRRKPEVQLALAKKQKERETHKPIATKTKRQVFWTEVMENPCFELKERLKASELLGKSEGDFIDRVQHSGGMSLEHLVLQSMDKPQEKVIEATPVQESLPSADDIAKALEEDQ